MTMKILPSGHLTVFILSALTVLAFVLGGKAPGLVCVTALAMSLFFFRAPVRELHCCSNDMVAPIEGRVADLADYYIDQKLRQRWQRIDICRSLLGPWTLYSPLEGQIIDVWHQDNDELGRLELAVQLRSSMQDDFLLILVANPAFNFFDSSRLQPGSILGKGSDLGFCTLRRISICVPSNWAVSAGIASKIHARRDVLFQVGS